MIDTIRVKERQGRREGLMNEERNRQEKEDREEIVKKKGQKWIR